MCDMLEKLAELEHEQWMTWAKELMTTEYLSSTQLIRWNGCMVPYAELSEEMKELDRVYARKVLDVMTGCGCGKKNT